MAYCYWLLFVGLMLNLTNLSNGLEKHWEVLKYKMQVFNVSKCLIYIKVLGSFPTFRQILKTKNVKRKLKIK